MNGMGVKVYDFEVGFFGKQGEHKPQDHKNFERSRKGNSPDPQLRSLSMFKWKRMWGCTDNQDVGLEAATH